MVVIGGLALFGEVTIGLQTRVNTMLLQQKPCCILPGCHVRGSKATTSHMLVHMFQLARCRPCAVLKTRYLHFMVFTNLPAAVGDLTSGLADYNASIVSILPYTSKLRFLAVKARGAEEGVNTPFKLITSRIVASSQR